MPRKVIGLVGPIASGKGIVVEILKQKGYSAYSLSDVLKTEVQKRGLEVSRNNCHMISNELREKLGADILAKQTAEIIDKDNPEFVVIDAIRNPSEIDFLKQKYNAYIIGVIADQKRRYELFAKRGLYSSEIQNFEQFKELDDREMAQEGKHKQQVQACLELSDAIIENEGSVSDLTRKVENYLTSIGQT